MSSNIRPEHVSAFEALTSGEHSNFALFSCFTGGEPAAAIVAVTPEGDDYQITPLFVSVTNDMVLTDHDGVPAGGVAPRHEATIIFGSGAARLYHDGTTDPEVLREHGTIETYSFETEREKLHFLRGIEEAIGWLDFTLAEDMAEEGGAS